MYFVLAYPDPATDAPHLMYALLVDDAGCVRTQNSAVQTGGGVA